MDSFSVVFFLLLLLGSGCLTLLETLWTARVQGEHPTCPCLTRCSSPLTAQGRCGDCARWGFQSALCTWEGKQRLWKMSGPLSSWSVSRPARFWGSKTTAFLLLGLCWAAWCSWQGPQVPARSSWHAGHSERTHPGAVHTVLDPGLCKPRAHAPRWPLPVLAPGCPLFKKECKELSHQHVLCRVRSGGGGESWAIVALRRRDSVPFQTLGHRLHTHATHLSMYVTLTLGPSQVKSSSAATSAVTPSLPRGVWRSTCACTLEPSPSSVHTVSCASARLAGGRLTCSFTTSLTPRKPGSLHHAVRPRGCSLPACWARPLLTRICWSWTTRFWLASLIQTCFSQD